MLTSENFINFTFETTQKLKWNLKAFKIDYFQEEDLETRFSLNFHNLFS